MEQLLGHKKVLQNIILKILKEHQIIDNEINLEYNNVGELLSTKADENKEKKFLICPGKNDEEFTYSEFKAIVDQTTRFLIQSGLKKMIKYH